MASPIAHFTHQFPNHYLKLSNRDAVFECGACKVSSTGRSYRCNSCNFALHRSCASISSYELVVTFFMHPQHGLTLLTEHGHSAMTAPVTCDLCGELVRGMWYRCAVCNFDVHPVCSHIPQFISDPVHPNHRLQFSAGHLGGCDQCRGDCREWHYRCDGCDFDAHLECIATEQKSQALQPKKEKETQPEGEAAVYDGGNAEVKRSKREVVAELVVG